MVFKNAWKCSKCPQSNTEAGCPAWVEYVETQLETGEERITKECWFQAAPKFITRAIASANQASASVDAHRNDIIQAVGQGFKLLATSPVLTLPEPEK